MVKNVHVDGLRELDRALGELPKATAKNVLRRVLTKAATPIADTARGLAPDDPETGGNDLRSSISVGTKLGKRQAKLNRKSIRTGDAEKHFAEVYAGAGVIPHSHLQEFGTVNHGPHPFMRPAWDSKKGAALDTIKGGLWDEIQKAAQRLAKKQARLAAKG